MKKVKKAKAKSKKKQNVVVLPPPRFGLKLIGVSVQHALYRSKELHIVHIHKINNLIVFLLWYLTRVFQEFVSCFWFFFH